MLSPSRNSANLENVENDRLPVPEVEAGTEEQLRNFFHKYVNHERTSSKCYLDGRYFWKILSSYRGLVPSEMYIRINQSPPVPVAEAMAKFPLDTSDPRTAALNLNETPDLKIAPFEMLLTFDGEDLRRTKGYPERYRLIKLVIDIADSPDEIRGIVHSNLIYIDTKKKTVKRFEPLWDAPYLHPIDKRLKAFFNENLPEYHYTMSPEHPQKLTSDRCPKQGLCAAFVLKKAMLLLTHNPHHHDCQVHYPEEESLVKKWLGSWSHKKHKRHQHREFVAHSDADKDREEIKILQFADAIELEYGPLPGVAEIEAGLGNALLSGLGGYALGALTGGGLGYGGSYGSGYYPYNYSPIGGPYGYSDYGGYGGDYYDGYGSGYGGYRPVFSYGPSIVVGGRPYSRSYGYGGHHSGRHGDRRSRSPRSYRRSGEYGHRRRSNPALTGGVLGAIGGLLLGGSLTGALVGGLAGSAGGYLLSDPYNRNFGGHRERQHYNNYRYRRW